MPVAWDLLSPVPAISPVACGAKESAGLTRSRSRTRTPTIFNAVPELLRRFEVNAVYAPPGTFDGKSGSVRALRTALDDHGVPIEHLTAGDRLRFGKAVVEVLHPLAGSLSEHDNAASMVLSMEYGGRRIIIPGDVDGEGLTALLNSPSRPCEVLLAPHHGSLKTDATRVGSLVLTAVGRRERLLRESHGAGGGSVSRRRRGGALHGGDWGGDGDGGDRGDNGETPFGGINVRVIVAAACLRLPLASAG